jgi:hypothetical protein
MIDSMFDQMYEEFASQDLSVGSTEEWEAIFYPVFEEKWDELVFETSYDEVEFYEEAPDTICVDSDMIVTEEECEQAMTTLGDWGYVSTYNSPNVIPGCYYNSNSRQIGFNPNVDGVNTYGNVSGSICRYEVAAELEW